MSVRNRLALAVLLLVSWGSPVRAQVPLVPTPAPERPAEGPAQRQAHAHFGQALELYRAGRYALALAELERAAALDPNGKDLLFNLALVHEKLGQLEQAIAALTRFSELESDPVERERAQVTIQRLRGALAESSPARLAEVPAPCPVAKLPPEPRFEPLVLGAASVAIVSLVVGAVFGVKALAEQPRGETTSSSSSITTLRARGARAERSALVADVAFALSVAAGGTALALVLLRPQQGDRMRGAVITLRSEF